MLNRRSENVKVKNELKKKFKSKIMNETSSLKD